eukprot:534075-Amorphochlora_amoeboformis.AAC.1
MQCVKLPFGMAYLHKQWVQDTIDVKTPYGSGYASKSSKPSVQTGSLTTLLCILLAIFRRLIGCKGDMQTVQLAFGIAYIKEDNVKDVDH